MKSSRLIAPALALILAGSAVSAVSVANAYPVGRGMTVVASKYVVSPPGTRITAQARNVYPGCNVSFRFQNQRIAAVTARSNAFGQTPIISIATPSTAGTYTLVAQSASNCRPPYGVETATVSIQVKAKVVPTPKPTTSPKPKEK